MLFVCGVAGVLTQGGGVFDTFVSSFYLQFSSDGRQWFTYKELITDARPKAKVTHDHSTSTTDTSIHVPLHAAKQKH